MRYMEPWWAVRRSVRIVCGFMLFLAAISVLSPDSPGSVSHGNCPPPSVAPLSRVPDPAARVLVVYINGVDTPPLTELDAVCYLGGVMVSAGLQPTYAGGGPMLVRSFKNRTRVEELLHEDRDVTTRVMAAVWMLEQPGPPPGDIVEAGREVRNIQNGYRAGTSLNPDALGLAEMIAEEVLDGRRVVLVPHSQGNLLVHEALHVLQPGKLGLSGGQIRQCLGVVSLASPLSVPWPADVTADQIWVSGDVIYHPLLARRTHVRPDPGALVSTAESPASGEEFRIWNMPRNVRLHGVTSSYLSAPEAREAIVRKLRERYDVLSTRACPPTPEPRFAGTWTGKVDAWGDVSLSLAFSAGKLIGTARLSGEDAGREIPLEVTVRSRRAISVRLAHTHTTPVELYMVGGQAPASVQLKLLRPDGEVDQVHGLDAVPEPEGTRKKPGADG